MVNEIISKKDRPFEWIEVIAPQQEEMNELKEKYNLEESSVIDCLQPGHFPKYEEFDDYTFIVFRAYLDDGGKEVDTIRSISSKMAFFVGEDYLITVSTKHITSTDKVKEKWLKTDRSKDPNNLLISLLQACLFSYEAPTEKLSKLLDYYEEQVFLRQRTIPILKGLYYVKREVDVIKRLLILSFEVIDKVDSPDNSSVYTRDMRDLYIKYQNTFDNLSENTSQLLSAYFSTSSLRTNEIMRVLTIFSVFFMPLTFIVGVYGMNFKNMPELEWYFGYPLVMIFMLLMTIIIYIWFKRKRWL